MQQLVCPSGPRRSGRADIIQTRRSSARGGMVRSMQWSFVGTGKGFDRVIGEIEVVNTLFAVKKVYPRVGVAMLETFCSGQIIAEREGSMG